MLTLKFSFFRELLLNHNQLRVLPYEIGKLFNLQNIGLKGNPLTMEIQSVYSDSNGTLKLLNYMLDNLAGKIPICLCLYCYCNKSMCFLINCGF